MSYHKNRGTTGTNRTLISNRQAIQGKKLGLFNCYCPKINHQNANKQKAMAFTTNMNEQKLFAIQG